jgi:hypothetical protein
MREKSLVDLPDGCAENTFISSAQSHSLHLAILPDRSFPYQTSLHLLSIFKIIIGSSRNGEGTFSASHMIQDYQSLSPRATFWPLLTPLILLLVMTTKYHRRTLCYPPVPLRSFANLQTHTHL